MIKNVKRFGYFLASFACVFIFCGVLTVWAGSGNATRVSTDQRAIYAGNSSDSVSLMFNVYSGTEYINEIMQTLNQYNATATFFIGGVWAEKNEGILSDIVNNGYEIGSHGYFHKDHAKLGYKENYEEMNVTHKLIKNITGIELKLFAPPSGSYSKATLDAAEDMGYSTILWSKDTIDWRDDDVDLIIKRATENVKGGDLVLMHPTASTSKALPEILKRIADEGLNTLVVSEIIR